MKAYFRGIAAHVKAWPRATWKERILFVLSLPVSLALALCAIVVCALPFVAIVAIIWQHGLWVFIQSAFIGGAAALGMLAVMVVLVAAFMFISEKGGR
ncbi:MAG TPA: hypothetical protein VEH27_00850 [Methylomirabilota bacterium]|nr:hypothetical protein [Methylomirabilota bacterium]